MSGMWISVDAHHAVWGTLVAEVAGRVPLLTQRLHGRSQLAFPLPNRFMRNDDAPLEEHLRQVPKLNLQQKRHKATRLTTSAGSCSQWNGVPVRSLKTRLQSRQ